jgi:high-affinity nickel-transport protein
MTRSIQRFLNGWRNLTGSEKRQAGGMLATIAALNAAGWGIFAVAILPHHFHHKGLGIGIGVAFTAWTLGCRHALDADHIAAIDNSTRKLMADGKRPLGTGFFFALGHSSVMLVVGTGITRW